MSFFVRIKGCVNKNNIPPKKWSMWDLTDGVCFSWYQSTELEFLKKNPSRWNIGVFTYIIHAMSQNIPVRLPPLQTEFRHFCEMKYLLKKETHNKNKDNTLKELNEIFLMLFWKYDHCHISTRDIVCEDRGTLIPHLKNQGILGEIVHAQLYTGSFWRPFFLLEES